MLKNAPPWLISLIFHLALMLLLALVTLQSSAGNSLLLTFTRGGDTVASTIANFSLQPVELDADSFDEVSLPELSLQQIATQSLHHYGGPLWEEWNERLRVDVPATQEKQGAERGSWSPQRDAWGAHAGRLYTTCLSLFCLEVYYRHMPLYETEGDTLAVK